MQKQKNIKILLLLFFMLQLFFSANSQQIQNLLNNNGNQSGDYKSFVMFKAHPQQTYGFDEPDSSLTSLYQYYQPPNNVGGTDQFIRWKSIKAGGTDKVFARLDSANTTIKFYDEANNPIQIDGASNDTLKILNLTSGAEGTKIIRAEININDTTTQVVGMFNLIAYPPKTTNLVVVPVNGNNLPGGISSTEFKAQLEKIYGVAAMTWNVTLGQNINCDYALADQTATFNAWPAGGSPYTPDMINLIAQLVTSGNYDENKYYLFLLDNSEISGQLGIMPFSQQYAFVFVDKFNQDGRFIKTTAHELAHGIFNLEHQYKFHTGIDTFATPNLMTYHPTATKLNKYQWDRIQNPLDRGYHDAGDEGQIKSDEYNFKITENENSSEHENNSTVKLLKANRTIKFECLKDNAVKKAEWYIGDNFQKDSISFTLIINAETEDTLIIKADKLGLLNNKFAVITIELNDFNIEDEVLYALNTIKTNYTVILDTLKLEFDTLTTFLNTYITDNNYDRFLIAGIDDIYASVGMSAYFTNLGNDYTGLDLTLYNMIQKDIGVLQYTELISKINTVITDKTTDNHTIWSQFVLIISDNTETPEDPLNFNFKEYQAVLLTLVQNKLVEFEIN